MLWLVPISGHILTNCSYYVCELPFMISRLKLTVSTLSLDLLRGLLTNLKGVSFSFHLARKPGKRHSCMAVIAPMLCPKSVYNRCIFRTISLFDIWSNMICVSCRIYYVKKMVRSSVVYPCFFLMFSKTKIWTNVVLLHASFAIRISELMNDKYRSFPMNRKKTFIPYIYNASNKRPSLKFFEKKV